MNAHMDRFTLLVGVIQQLSRTRNLDQIQAIVRKAARELTGADGATFVLRDGDYCYYADEDAIEPLWKGRRFLMSQCVSGWVMNHAESAVIEDIYADERVPQDAYRPTFVRSLAMVPICTQKPIGAIGNYWATKRKPTDDEIQLLAALADSTSIAIENVALYRALEKQISDCEAALGATQRAEAAVRAELEEHQKTQAKLFRSEEQLRQSQKMEAIGQLAGGIAHDFNNMLSVILGYSSMLLSDLGSSEPMREDIEQINLAGERAAGLTRQLLAFSRQQMLAPKVVNLNETVSNIEKMLSRLLGENIQLKVTGEPQLGNIMADVGQLEQVIVNLAVNARDAMPKGGMLAINTTNCDLDETFTNQYVDMKPGQYVMIAVSDNGIGIDQMSISRIFEPFFTTKERGKGTGLGLSTVYGIVKQSGGQIWVESELGRGTTFRVVFPRYNLSPVDKAQQKETHPRLTGSETILLVEDDSDVRLVARGILKKSGYQVVIAESPEEALSMVTKWESPIDLLLTDMMMPGMTGVELAEKTRQIRPELRVLCMSGYTDDTALKHGLMETKLAYIQKPLSAELLLQKVWQVLHESLPQA